MSEPHVTLPADRLWTAQQAAAYLQIGVKWLRESGCPTIRLAITETATKTQVRYRKEDIDNWLETLNSNRRFA